MDFPPAPGDAEPQVRLVKVKLPPVAEKWRWYGVLWTVAGLIFALALGRSFVRAAIKPEFWANSPPWWFVYGAVLWVLVFMGYRALFGEPRLLRFYVFGHELTHAIWNWLSQGRLVSEESQLFNRDGGYVTVTKNNFIIALSPYIYPFYTMALMLVVAVVNVVGWAGERWLGWHFYLPENLLAYLTGVTWSFHLTFTLYVLPIGQSDLRHYGRFFSIALIFAGNVLLISTMFILLSPHLTFVGYARNVVWFLTGFWARVFS